MPEQQYKIFANFSRIDFKTAVILGTSTIFFGADIFLTEYIDMELVSKFDTFVRSVTNKLLSHSTNSTYF